jgi:WD40 repeat protein
VRVWDVESGRLISTLGGHLGETSALQFLADNKTLAVAGVGPIRLWDVEIGQECMALYVPDYKTFGLALSPDGQTLISRSDHGVVRLWKATR